MAVKLTNQLVRIPEGCSIVRANVFEDYDELIISRPIPEERICPSCGSAHCVVKSAMEYHSARHIAISRRPTILTYQKQRFACMECGSTFYYNPDWVLPGLKITRNLAADLFTDLMETSSLHHIALKNGISYSVLQTFFDHIEISAPTSLPETICIDEFKGETGVWDSKKKKFITEKFHTAVADSGIHRIIDVIPSRRAQDVIDYFMKYSPDERKMVRYFCCDMSNSYVSVAKRCFPSAAICIDLFHVVQRLNGAVDAVRRRLQHEAREKGDQESYLLLFHLSLTLKTAKRNIPLRWNISAEKKEAKLQRAFDLFPELHYAYLMLQDFHSVLDEKTLYEKRLMLGKWILDYVDSECPDVAAAARTIRYWKQMIVNSWQYNRSNGPAEGLNDKIKVVKRLAFGMHRFDAFRKRILLICGPIVPPDEYVRIQWDQLKKADAQKKTSKAKQE